MTQRKSSPKPSSWLSKKILREVRDAAEERLAAERELNSAEEAHSIHNTPGSSASLEAAQNRMIAAEERLKRATPSSGQIDLSLLPSPQAPRKKGPPDDP